MNRDLRDLIELDDLEPSQRQRLEEVHDLLNAVGPPPALTPALREPPAPENARIVKLPDRRRRRAGLAAIAAVVAAVAFGGGYLLGHQSESSDVVRVVSMRGVNMNAVGSLRVGEEEPAGNWPMELTVTGLPEQQGERDYYELFVWRRGKPSYPCVGFKMQGATTTVRFTVPYEFRDSTKLVVTAIEPGEDVRWPGRVVMRTV
ncbi:MAG TPA: hypothetical protein VH721_00940 [Gaiellaceae bacterium]|jgi:hypothetical protein